MPQLHTPRFGALEYEEAALLDFPAGLPGFEDQRRFLIVDREDLAPVVFLQSLDLPALCFLALPVAVVDPSYELAIIPEDLRTLGLDDRRQPLPEEIACLALLAAAEDGRWTANLLAPVVINARTRRALQAVRMDSRYSHSHPMAAREASCS